MIEIGELGIPNDPGPSQTSRERVIALINEQGWNVEDANPDIDIVARALDGFAAAGLDAPLDYLEAFTTTAQAAEANISLSSVTRLEGQSEGTVIRG